MLARLVNSRKMCRDSIEAFHTDDGAGGEITAAAAEKVDLAQAISRLYAGSRIVTHDLPRYGLQRARQRWPNFTKRR